MDPLIQQRLDAVRTLRSNFSDAEVAGAFFKIQDGLLGMNDLQAIVRDPMTGADLKNAARFFIDHPDEFKAIAKTPRPFGIGVASFISQSDIDEAVTSAQKARDTAVRNRGGLGSGTVGNSPLGPNSSGACPTPPASSGGNGITNPSTSAPASSAIKDILADSTLSTQQKLQQILWAVMENMDNEMLQLGADMDDTMDQRKALSKDEADKQKDLDRDMDKMTSRLQELSEKRQAMFELMSNLNLKNSEMARRAIQNLGQ